MRPKLQCDSIRSLWPLGDNLGLEGAALMNGISAFIKEAGILSGEDLAKIQLTMNQEVCAH